MRREEYAMRNDTPDGATNYSLILGYEVMRRLCPHGIRVNSYAISKKY